MKSCFSYEIDGYYREIKLPFGFKARIHSLSSEDYSDIRKKAGFKFNMTKDVLVKMKKDKDYQPEFDMDIDVFRKEKIISSLTDPVDLSFEKGGSGWDLTDKKNNIIKINLRNIKYINKEILEAIESAILEFDKATKELEGLEKNWSQRFDI